MLSDKENNPFKTLGDFYQDDNNTNINTNDFSNDIYEPKEIDFDNIDLSSFSSIEDLLGQMNTSSNSSTQEDLDFNIDEIHLDDEPIIFDKNDKTNDIDKKLEDIAKNFSDENRMYESYNEEDYQEEYNIDDESPSLNTLDDLLKQVESGSSVTQYEKPKGFLSSFIEKFKPKKSDELGKNYDYEYSKFREYIFLLDDFEDDGNILRAVEICDDSLKLDRHKVYLNKKIKEYDTILEDIKCYDNLTDEEADYLKTLIDKYIHLNNERRSIRYQMGDFSNSISKLEALQEDAQDAIYQMEDAEKSKRLLSRDIQIIRDEKERTMIDRQRMQFAYKILYRFSFIISLVLGFSIISLSLFSVSTNQSVFIPLSVLCIVLVFTIVIIYAFRKKLVFELKLNEKKYAKLVNLLNKKTVVVSYYINFLNFAYKKYNVKNTRTLKNNLADFSNYKHIVTRYDNLGKLVFEVQKQLEDFLMSKRISVHNTSLEAFAKSINIDNKIAYFKDISLKKQRALDRVNEIDRDQKVLLEELDHLQEIDISKEKVVEKIIKAYLNETEKMLSEEDEETFEKLNPNL